MKAPGIAILVEAGEWPPETALQDLAERAVEAAAEACRQEASRDPSPSPSPPNTGVPVLGMKDSEVGNTRLRAGGEFLELSIVFTDDAAMRKLNAKWRGKDAPTNVLSFPQAGPPNPEKLLGDVILSAETLAREATLADKPLEDHMAHLIIHGYLHLLGFDHEAEGDAAKMEQLERVALKFLGIDDPYAAAS